MIFMGLFESESSDSSIKGKMLESLEVSNKKGTCIATIEHVHRFHIH